MRPTALTLATLALAGAAQSVRLAVSPAPVPPAAAAGLIEQGLRLEIDGDLPAAERSLEAAAAADRTAKPLSTLAAFHARGGSRDRFRHWAARLAALPGADLRGLFVAAFRLDEADRIPAMLPPRAEPWRQWLIAAMAAGRLDLAGPAALELAALAGSGDGWRAALDFCDRAIAAGDPAPALAVSRALHLRRLTPTPPPTADQPVTNGSFAHSPVGHGFDWRVHEPAGVSRIALPGALRFEFHAAAAGAILAEQWMPLDPGASYVARWRAESPLDGIEILLPGAIADAAAGGARFVAPGPLGRLAIRAGRRSGGEVTFREFRIERAAR